jgi:putative transposase
MDEAHLMAAFRYVAMNPVKAKLAATAADWRWSSTRAHLFGRDDELVKVNPLLDRIDNDSRFLGSDVDPALELALTKGQTVGRPLMSDEALASLEKELKCCLRPARRCRPKKLGDGNING